MVERASGILRMTYNRIGVADRCSRLDDLILESLYATKLKFVDLNFPHPLSYFMQYNRASYI